ncbi:antitoxin [Klenkia sp. PcliD-1-E]|uniref:antitoxin n=1 Tax=Klenkia sp. PcliD-1-E TaxID=2954492 RepID=UPI00209725E9|nr:antitoxin [Klenkia sp. PcliD-1-E]MCO7221222.1 antitoxin [Klenkia sp. PcliD-1-E]
MRTTLSIDDGVLAAAKRRAAERGQTLGQVVEAALRRDLGRPEVEVGPPIPVVTRGSGPAPGLDLTSNRAMAEYLDEGVPLEKLR